MSKKAIILSAALLLSPMAHAGFTPAEGNCHDAGGRFWILDAGTANDLELCRFGAAAISDLALYDYTVNHQADEAVQAYLASASPNPGACSEDGGTIRQRTDTNGITFTLCEFDDGSAVDEATLEQGNRSPENSALTQALSR